MAGTPLFLRATTGISHPASIDSASKSAALPAGADKSAVARTAFDLSVTKGAAQTTRTFATGAAAALVSGRFDTWVYPFTGSGGAGGDITAENWTVGTGLTESNADANQFLAVSIYVLKADGTVRGYVYDSATALATEPTTAERERVATVAGSAVTGILSTDFLCVEVWTTGTTGSASSRTITHSWDGTVIPSTANTTSDCASFVQPASLNLATGIGASAGGAVNSGFFGLF